MSERTLSALLRETRECHPDRIAVRDGTGGLTYAELDDESNRLANLLVAAGVRPGDRVGLDLPKSAGAVIGGYGILKAGAGYVPLDPRAPASRLGHIVRDCRMSCAVTGAATLPAWRDRLAGNGFVTRLVVPDATDAAGTGTRPPVLGRAALLAQPVTAPPTVDRGDGLAYILYTSGSTGKPKGVTVGHDNALPFVRWAVREFGLTRHDRLASHAPFHFDLSVFDLFAAAAAGAEVVLVPPWITVFPAELAALIETARITVWYSVPSALTALVRRGGLAGRDLGALRAVLFAGEVFPTPQLRLLMDRLPHARFANLYGPTETNVCTCYHVPPLPAGMSEPIPIGRAIPCARTFAVTDDGRLAGVGETGELHVAGPTVMRGYWGDPAGTRRALIPAPHGDPGEFAYRTGDLVRLGPDGDYRFLGRRDHQVKSRGYRVELGEIEAALHADQMVAAAAAVAVPDDEITNRLVACVVTIGAADPLRLARACARRLPRHLCPGSFVFYDALPLTSTGKVDRAALARDPRVQPGSAGRTGR